MDVFWTERKEEKKHKGVGHLGMIGKGRIRPDTHNFLRFNSKTRGHAQFHLASDGFFIMRLMLVNSN